MATRSDGRPKAFAPRTCADCPAVYTPAGPHVPRCPACSLARKRTNWRAGNRRYRSRVQRRRWLEQTRGRQRCAYRLGGRRTCRGLLEVVFDRLGRMGLVCPICERRKAGVCQDCPRPVEGRKGTALRCREHKRAALLRHRRVWARNDRAEKRERRSRRLSTRKAA